ncbi:MAG: class I SAM-dependent rRNA methyltransferase [Cyclobacteriaceae bacterium]|nr:class I SAM-dependent rRNA methyltransferase [Cyclobacteriaceae bacterium]
MEIQGQVYLKKGRDASARRFHPWIFSGAIQSIEGNPESGAWVCVKDASGTVLGYGHYQKGTITARLLSFRPEPPGDDFFSAKIASTLAIRQRTGVISADTDCYRLVHGEGDGLAGLIVDIYRGVAVIQAHSSGMHRDRQRIKDALLKNLGNQLTAVYYKGMSAGDGKSESEYLFGMGAVPHAVVEHGNKFLVDWEGGQKTGFFLDQRENRRLLGSHAAGRSVLNTFCYTGGFSVYALQAGATLVHSIDASERAVELARQNIELNAFDVKKHECFIGDTFDFLKDKKDQYDIIILDPPAFAKHKEARHQAMKGYQRLNAEAMRVIRSGGLLFTFSCSQVVDRQLFYDTVVSAAIQAGREAKVLYQLSQPPDHPVSIYHPEGEYLKGLVLYIS